MILALRGGRADLCPVNPIPLEVCYNMSQCPLCKLPDIAEDALTTELLDW